MLKNKLKNTLKNKKGFTLAELLIVVAIIAILVAISIPVFTGQLNKAKKSTDEANERAAKAAAINEYYEQQKDFILYYDAENGKIVNAKDAKKLKPYGKQSDNTTKIIQVNVDANGNVKTTWILPANAQ